MAKCAAPHEAIGKRHLSLINWSAGVIFLGTPHAEFAYSTVGKLIPHSTYWLSSSTVLLNAMNLSSEAIGKLEDSFLLEYKDLATIDFHEVFSNTILGFRIDLVKTPSHIDGVI